MKKISKAERAVVDHGEPSAQSLREIPECDPATSVRMGRGTEGMRRAMAFARAVRGRPKKGQKAAGSRLRSIRLSDEAWAEFEREAEQRKMSLHQLLKLVVAEWLYAPKMLSRDERQGLVAHKPTRKPAKRRARKAA
jgi:hypothetical protein